MTRWKYDNKHMVDEDQWKENFKTNQMLFERTTIFSCPYSPTISQTMIEEILQDEQNKQLNIVKRDYDIQTKELRIHNVCYDDQEITISSPDQTNVPLG